MYDLNAVRHRRDHQCTDNLPPFAVDDTRPEWWRFRCDRYEVTTVILK